MLSNISNSSGAERPQRAPESVAAAAVDERRCEAGAVMRDFGGAGTGLIAGSNGSSNSELPHAFTRIHRCHMGARRGVAVVIYLKNRHRGLLLCRRLYDRPASFRTAAASHLVPNISPLGPIRIKAKLGRKLAEFLRADQRKAANEIIPKLGLTQFVKPRYLGRRRIGPKADLGRNRSKPRALLVGQHPLVRLLMDFLLEPRVPLAANVFHVIAQCLFNHRFLLDAIIRH